MSERRCFRIAYPNPCHKDREPYFFKLRDGDAAGFIIDRLAKRGYRYAGPIVNYPSSGPQLIPYDDGFMGEDDILLVTTRPPMEDSVIGNRKGIPRSYTTLEEKLFEGPFRERFKTCARSEIVLQNETAAISPEIAKRQSLIFQQNRAAMYQAYGSPVTRKWRRFRKTHALTAAFLLYVEHAWPGGPALLAAFGVGGMETLVWCYHLANRLEHLLFTTPFAMAELRPAPLAEPPTSIHFADAWEVTILGVAPPPRGPGSSIVLANEPVRGEVDLVS